MPVWLQVLAGVVSTIGSIIAASALVMRTLSRLDRRLEHLEVMTATVEYQNRALLRAFPPVISTLMAGNLMTPQQGSQLIASALETRPVSDILSAIKPTLNPLTRSDLDRLNGYVVRLKQSQRLTADEARDFYRLTDVITREYPSNEGTWVLFFIAGVLLGTILSDKN